MLFLVLMAFSPPQGAVPFGPPAPHLDRVPDQQARRSARLDWQRFRATWGDWVVRWDPRNDTPRFLLAPGVALSRAPEVLRDVAALARVPGGELAMSQAVTRGDRELLVYTRTWRGAPVEGDEVLIIAQSGRITGVRVQLTPVRLTQTPRPGEVVFVDPDGQAWLTRRTTEGVDVVYRDRDGEVVYRYDTRLFSEVLVSHEERTVGDDVVESPARNITVEDADGNIAYTDADGIHSLTGSLTATLTGPELLVRVGGQEISKSGTDDLLFVGGVDMPLSAGTVQHHFHVVWDWLKARWPDHPWLSQQVPATVEAPGGTCNAWYTSGTISFLPGNGQTCNNFGRIADVVYHEVGHGIHDYIRVAGTFAGDVSEGSADYISATILDDPVLAPNARPDGSYIREIDTDRVYPDDIVGEVHSDGLIWASFMWNLREQWQDTYGETDGAELADLILLGALELGPTLTDLTEAVLLADDDDGDTTNGTPHDCELIELLNHHGLGPGSLGVLTFAHEPLDAQASATEGYPVSFDVSTWPSACAAFDTDSVGLWYTTDPDATLTEGDWHAAELSSDGLTWSGEIPRQPANTEVRYYLTASSIDGTEVVTTHGGRQDALYSFRVGDRDPLYCEGFEHGAKGWSHGPDLPWSDKKKSLSVDDWVIGSPSGAADNPAEAWEGGTVAGTNLDGSYTPSSTSHLQSPVWTVEAPGPMFLLSYRRFLTVEDGYYDQARIWLDEEVLWENPASESGTEAHLIDTDWTLHDISLAGVSGDIQLTWSLAADGGLQYGGWALDEVCLVQLADPEGHYRPMDLVASDGEGPVEITWTQPWVTPLSATVLVRSADDWPSGPTDGVIIDVDLTPTPGEARSVTDPDAAPGERFYYALFAAGADDEDWYDGVVEGENADIGSIDAPPDTGEPAAEDTGETEDTASPPVEQPEGCGCSSGGRGGLGGLILPLLILLRRRRLRG
jgi:hypothetical protein